MVPKRNTKPALIERKKKTQGQFIKLWPSKIIIIIISVDTECLIVHAHLICCLQNTNNLTITLLNI